MLQDRLTDVEQQLDLKRKEVQNNETALIRYGDSLKELEIEFDRRETEMNSLK